MVLQLTRPEYCENANWIGIMASPLTIGVLDTPGTPNWFKIFTKYRVPLNVRAKDGRIFERRKWSWALRWNSPGMNMSLTGG